VHDLLGEVDLEVADDLAAGVAPPLHGREVGILNQIPAHPDCLFHRHRLVVIQDRRHGHRHHLFAVSSELSANADRSSSSAFPH
jgi:hypothetical protein